MGYSDGCNLDLKILVGYIGMFISACCSRGDIGLCVCIHISVGHTGTCGQQLTLPTQILCYHTLNPGNSLINDHPNRYLSRMRSSKIIIKMYSAVKYIKYKIAVYIRHTGTGGELTGLW